MYILKDVLAQKILDAEFHRQSEELELIASENYASKEVIMAYANVFTNKYSEGYVWKRYYWGQTYVDQLERLTQYRWLKIFDLVKEELEKDWNIDFEAIEECLKNSTWWINVQPISWSPANLAVYMAVLQQNDVILWMDLSHGWHLSHGHPLNASWLFYSIQFYGVKKDTFLIDYDQILQQALDHKPAVIVAWFSAYSRSIDWQKFAEVADAVERKHGYRPFLMADIAHISWLIAWKTLSGPFDHFDIVTTTTHKTLRWPRSAVIYFKKWKLTRNWKEFNLEKSINRGVFPWVQWGPHDHVCLAKCVGFGEILNSNFGSYTDKVVKNAQRLAAKLIEHGWDVLSWWTDNHIVIFNTTSNNWKATWHSWQSAEEILERVWLSVNKNLLPYDTGSALNPSWIRLGTPAITTRWLWQSEIDIIADVINNALLHSNDEELIQKSKDRIATLAKQFPLPY